MTGGAIPCRHTRFEWRASLGAWRWLILGALGASAPGCGGKAASPSGDPGGAGAPDDRAPRIGTLNPLASPAGLYRACEPGACPIPGRPFLVAGMPRSAAGVERSDWCSRADAEVEAPRALAPALRAEIARGWNRR